MSDGTALEPEPHGSDPGGDPPESDAFEPVLEGVRAQLRDAIEAANRAASQQVASAAEAVAAREAAVTERENELAAETERLQADRISLTERLAEANELRRQVDADLAEASGLKERASSSLADALERSAQLLEETQARVREEETRLEAQVRAAEERAAELEEQAETRLEAARTEAAALLERAVERSLAIVAEAEDDADRLRGPLRELSGQIESFLEWEAGESSETNEPADPAPAEIDLRSPSDDDAETAGEDGADDTRVVDAVRRAVRGWATRHNAE